MKLGVLISLLIFLLTASAFATVENSEGFSTADPVFGSDDAYVRITGEAATQLYNHLSVTPGPFGGRKQGQNIACSIELNFGGSTGKLTHVCAISVRSDGSVY